MSTPTATVDVGTAVCRAIVLAVQAVRADRGLDAPALASHLTGAELPIADACEGMVWARVAGTYPTVGDGQPYIAAPVSWEVPAWAIPVEVGALWCHQNITEDGEWIDNALEAEYATRDGGWRSALLEAVGYRWKPATDDPLCPAVMGQSIGTWTPVGPYGGYSGGIIVTTVVVSGLWLCE